MTQMVGESALAALVAVTPTQGRSLPRDGVDTAFASLISLGTEPVAADGVAVPIGAPIPVPAPSLDTSMMAFETNVLGRVMTDDSPGEGASAATDVAADRRRATPDLGLSPPQTAQKPPLLTDDAAAGQTVLRAAGPASPIDGNAALSAVAGQGGVASGPAIKADVALAKAEDSGSPAAVAATTRGAARDGVVLATTDAPARPMDPESPPEVDRKGPPEAARAPISAEGGRATTETVIGKDRPAFMPVAGGVSDNPPTDARPAVPDRPVQRQSSINLAPDIAPTRDASDPRPTGDTRTDARPTDMPPPGRAQTPVQVLGRGASWTPPPPQRAPALAVPTGLNTGDAMTAAGITQRSTDAPQQNPSAAVHGTAAHGTAAHGTSGQTQLTPAQVAAIRDKDAPADAPTRHGDAQHGAVPDVDRPAPRTAAASMPPSGVTSAFAGQVAAQFGPATGPTTATILSGEAATLPEVPSLLSVSDSAGGSLTRALEVVQTRPETVARSVPSQVAEAMRASATDNGAIEVRLSPEELGRVRVTLSSGEAGLQVMLTAERQETLDLLRRNIGFLEADLRQQGYSGMSFSFAQDPGGEWSQHADRDDPDETSSPTADVAVTHTDDPPKQQTHAAPERIDLRL